MHMHLWLTYMHMLKYMEFLFRFIISRKKPNHADSIL